jgi:hypothetical protein
MRCRLWSFSRKAATPDSCACSRMDVAVVSTTTGSPRRCSVSARPSPSSGPGSRTSSSATSGRWTLIRVSAARVLPAAPQTSRSGSAVSSSRSARRTRRSQSMMSTLSRRGELIGYSLRARVLRCLQSVPHLVGPARTGQGFDCRCDARWRAAVVRPRPSTSFGRVMQGRADQVRLPRGLGPGLPGLPTALPGCATSGRVCRGYWTHASVRCVR